MPVDAFFAAKKNTILDIIKARDCSAAMYIDDNGNDYNELVDMLIEFSKTFDCDPAYLDLLLAPFDDVVDLMPNGVYYNKTSITITNPKFVVKCTTCDILINAGGLYDEVDITYNSTITGVTVTNNTILDVLNVGGGSVVDLVTVNAGSCITALLVKACGAFVSTLTKVAAGSCVKNIGVDETAIFGGIECDTSV